MRVLKARFQTRPAFLAAFQHEAAQEPASADISRVFCATTTAVDVGEQVLVEVNFPDLPNRVVLRGQAISWRPAAPRLGIRAGAQVLVDGDQKAQIDFLLGVAHGTRKAGPRRSTRLPIELPVRVRAVQSTRIHQSGLREISVSAAVLRPEPELVAGAEVVLELMPPGAERAAEIAGRVTHSNADGTVLEFHARDTGGLRRLREMLRRFKFES